MIFWKSDAATRCVSLPPELWRQIIYLAAEVDGALDIDPEDVLIPEDIHARIRESIPTRHSLLTVSKQFHAMSSEFFYKIIMITRPEQLMNMARKLRDYPELSNNVARWARRLDLCFSRAVEDDSLRGGDIYVACERILRTCQNLSHLTWSFVPHLRHTSGFLATCAEFSKDLQVVYWASSIQVDLSKIFTSCPRLRIVKLLTPVLSFLKEGIPPSSLSNLHTIRSSIGTFFLLESMRLPALVSLCLDDTPCAIPIPPHRMTRFMQNFFTEHGDQITRFVGLRKRASEFAIGNFLHYCHNLRDLVYEMHSIPILRGTFPRVERLGILFMETEQPTWEYTFEFIKGSFGAVFPALTVVRILDAKLMSIIRSSPYSLRLWDRRFRGIGVRLEDSTGNALLLPGGKA